MMNIQINKLNLISTYIKNYNYSMASNLNPDLIGLNKQAFLKFFLDIYSLPKYSDYVINATEGNAKKNIDQLKNKIQKLQNQLRVKKDPQLQQFTPEAYLKRQMNLKQKLVAELENLYPNLFSFAVVHEVYKSLQKTHGSQCQNLMNDIVRYHKDKKMRKYVDGIIEAKFKYYDEDGTGEIDIQELENKVQKFGLPKLIAKGIMENADSEKNGLISFSQFKKYTQGQILKYYKVFYRLDSDKDEKLNKFQAKQSLHQIYPDIDIENAFDKLYDTMDQDKSGFINFQQWCDFLIIFPQQNLNMIINQWGMIASTMISPEQSSSWINKDLIQGNKVKNGKRVFGPMDIVRTLIFGGIAGALSRTVTAPLQRIKVLSQTMYQDTKCPGVIAGLKDTYAKHGLSALFRGNSISVFLNCLEQGLRFTIIEYSKRSIEVQGNTIHPHEFLFIGIVTGISSSFVLFPFEVLRIRFITDNLMEKVFQSAKSIYSESGIRGFYSGLTPYLLSVLPAGSFNVVSYNLLRKFFIKESEGQKPHISKFMLIGGIASLITNTVTYPLSLLTSRLIMANKDIIQFKKKTKTHQLIKSIYQKEGLRGFFKGYVASTMRVAIGQSINFGTYESLKLVWNKKNQFFGPSKKAF